jgi:hypothetical protein
MLIGSKEKGAALGLKPRARIRQVAVTGSEPTIMLTGIGPASKKALKKAGMSTNDIDLFEINEAFAAVVMRAARDLDIGMDKINVNGGSIAMGHPLGATGCIILGTRAGRTRAHRQEHRPGLAVRRRRHGHRDDHRARLSAARNDAVLGHWFDSALHGLRRPDAGRWSADMRLLDTAVGRIRVRDTGGDKPALLMTPDGPCVIEPPRRADRHAGVRLSRDLLRPARASDIRTRVWAMPTGSNRARRQSSPSWTRSTSSAQRCRCPAPTASTRWRRQSLRPLASIGSCWRRRRRSTPCGAGCSA